MMTYKHAYLPGTPERGGMIESSDGGYVTLEDFHALRSALILARGWMGDGNGADENPICFTEDSLFVDEVIKNTEPKP